jgi:hypothetical protein
MALIPTRTEYEKCKLTDSIWWSKNDLHLFKISLVSKAQFIMKISKLSWREAVLHVIDCEVKDAEKSEETVKKLKSTEQLSNSDASEYFEKSEEIPKSSGRFCERAKEFTEKEYVAPSSDVREDEYALDYGNNYGCFLDGNAASAR